MRTVKELVKHLDKYKDAVIIVGPGVLEEANSYSIDEFNENYTRKALVRDSDKLWNFFVNKMYREITEKEVDIYKTINRMDNYSSLIINQNSISQKSDKMINLHGSMEEFTCTKCKTLYTSDYVFSKEPYENECELCGQAIRPTVLLSGERYNKLLFNQVEERVLEAHTIILIGMDYTEESLMKLIAHFGDVKAFTNEKGEEEKVLVAIQTKEEEFDPNEMTHFEFIVKDDIKSALNRLLDNIEGVE